MAEGFKTGAQVTLTLRDSTQAQGVFGGLVRLPDSLYAERYAAWQTGHDGVSFPRMGERITLTGYYGKRTEYLFYGFSYQPIWHSGELRPHVLVKRIEGGDMRDVELKTVTEIINSRGHAVPVNRLRAMFSEGKLPLASEVSIVGSRDSLLIATDRIAFITRPFKNQTHFIGAKTGVAIDGFIVVAALIAAGLVYFVGGFFYAT